jgi:hypothetical protein
MTRTSRKPANRAGIAMAALIAVGAIAIAAAPASAKANCYTENAPTWSLTYTPTWLQRHRLHDKIVACQHLRAAQAAEQVTYLRNADVGPAAGEPGLKAKLR